MTVLFTTLYGSRLYGTAMPESDRDEKQVVLPTIDSLLLGRAPKNSIKAPKKALGEKNTAGDEDIEQIPLQVFAQHFMESQIYALELVWAVEGNQAEQKIFDPRFLTFCRELRVKFMTRSCKAIVGYSVNQANIYSDKGERLNVLRAAEKLFEHFTQMKGVADCNVSEYAAQFEELAKPIAEQFPLYFMLSEYPITRAGDLRPCVNLLEKALPYSSSFKNNLAVVRAALNRYGSRAAAASADNVDWKAMMHAMRIVSEGVSVLNGEGLKFPYQPDYCAWLLQIKRGELDTNLVRELISGGVDRIEQLSANSSFPELNFELQTQFDTWLLGWLKQFYNL